MKLCNYLIDYREVHIDSCNEQVTNKILFQTIFNDIGVNPIVVGNGMCQPISRPSNEEKYTRIKGLMLSEKLKGRPRINKWG